MWAALSADLEPNKDDTLDGIPEAMDWFDRVVPRGTVYTTYRIATELPDLVASLAVDNEIGVHVHPREFGYDHDQLAELSYDQQEALIQQTREAITDACSLNTAEITAFRAGRHSANRTTLAVVADLGFDLDASVNVRYDEYLPEYVTRRRAPFKTEEGLIELPTTYIRPQFPSRPWLRSFPGGTITATANTLRTDRYLCSGEEAIRALVSSSRGVSLYFHPYDATNHHDLENAGVTFRRRFERLVTRLIEDNAAIWTASDVDPDGSSLDHVE